MLRFAIVLTTLVARIVARVRTACSHLGHHRALGRARPARSAGQATAEYALVLLGAAAIALVLVGWATRSGKIGELFDSVVGQLIGKST